MVSLTMRQTLLGEGTSLSRIASCCHLPTGGQTLLQNPAAPKCCRIQTLVSLGHSTTSKKFHTVKSYFMHKSIKIIV